MGCSSRPVEVTGGHENAPGGEPAADLYALRGGLALAEDDLGEGDAQGAVTVTVPAELPRALTPQTIDRPKALDPSSPPPMSKPALPSPKPLDGDKPSARLQVEEATVVPTRGTVRSADDGNIPVLRLKK